MRIRPSPPDGLVDWARHWLPQKQVGLLDTVVLDAAGRPEAWLYTSKSGRISVKQKTSWEQIGRRFSTFLQHEEVVTAIHQNGRRTSLSAAQWLRLVEDKTARHRLLRGIVAFQACLPAADDTKQLRCRVTGGDIDVTPENCYSDQLRQATLALEQEDVEAVFVVDKQHQLWLVDARRTNLLQQHERPILPALLATPSASLPSLSKTTTPPSWHKSVLPRKQPLAAGGKARRTAADLAQDDDANAFEDNSNNKALTIDEAPEGEGEETEEGRNHEHLLKTALLQAAAAEEEASAQAREASQARLEQCADQERFKKELIEKTQEVERAKLEVDAIRARAAATGQNSGSLQRSTSATVAGLLDQLEERGRALDEAKSAWAEERRELVAQAARQAHTAAVDAEARLDELRASIQDEQDRVTLLESELESSKAKLLVSTRQNSDMETQLEALAKEMREKDEACKTATQSIRAAASIERHLVVQNPADEENKVMGQSAVEARQRQLQNKVVFLKSSLETEMEARQELEKRLAESVDRLKTERAENDRRLSEANQLREASLKVAEERAASALEEAQNRAAHLENKLTQAQAAYTDALHDAGVARRREDAAKADAQREKTAREAAERAAELDRESLIAARDAKNGQTATKKEQRVEVTVDTGLSRRLENENQYLKAQLTSEAMCKGELEVALTKATEQVEAAQRQGEVAASKALESARVLAERVEKLERDLRSVASEKKANEDGLTKQLETLKAAYVKTRDGLRAEQAEHARTRMARGELISNMSQMRAERERAEQVLRDVRDRASGDLKAARRAFDDAEAAAAETNRSTRSELTAALGRVDQLRNVSFRLECKIRDGEIMTTRVGRVGAVLGLTSRRSSWNRPRAFSTWKHATLCERLVEEHRKALVEAEREAALRSASAVADAVQQAARADTDNLSAALAAEHAALTNASHRKLVEQEHIFGDRLASMVAATATHAVVERTVHKATLVELDEARAKNAHLQSRVALLTRDVIEREQQLAESGRTERRRRAMRVALAADSLAARAAVVADRLERIRENIASLSDEESCTDSPSRTELLPVQEARRAARAASAAVYAVDCSVAGEQSDVAVDAIDAAEASVAACTAWVVHAEKESNCDELGRAAREALAKVQRTRDEERQASQLSIEEKSQLVSDGREAFLSERAAKEASECAGLALRETVEKTRVELEDARDSLGKLSEATAQFAESEASRFEAAVVVADTLRVETERHGRARASWDASLASSAAASALASEAVDVERERWRESLRDAATRSDERQAAAWRSGMEERDRVAKREASELRAAAERAVAEVKASAAASLEAVRVDTKKAVDRAAQRALEHETLAVKNAVEQSRAQSRAVHKDAMAACLAAGVASKQLAVEKVRAAENAMRQNQKTQHDRAQAASRRECDQLRCKVADVEDRLASETRRLEAQRIETFSAIERAEARCKKEYEAEARAVALRRDANEAARVASSARAVNVVFETAMEAASAREHAAVVAVANDADRHIEAVVRDFEGRLDASQAAEAALSAIRSDQQATIGLGYQQLVSSRTERLFERRRSSFDAMKLAAGAMLKISREREAFDSQICAQHAALEKVKETSEVASRDAEIERRRVEVELEGRETVCAQMREVLVNYERATLMSHKERSAVLGDELKEILQRRDDAEAKRDQLLDGVEEMQEAVRELESSMREHNKTSSISRDGRVNLAHAKKKKRMDDDHDALLCDLEKQRTELSDIDQHIQRLNEEREGKEDEIKDLERQLVELLVTQQKKLLAILGARESAK